MQRIDALLADPSTLSSIFGWPSMRGVAQGGLGMVGAVPGTGAADAAAALEGLQGIVRTQAFESLKGGGQITEAESKFASEARANLARSQSPEAAMREL
ncbi:hypothetical protein RZS08_20810, partial [Arthrospira platensis SPKY1]|nr:hypothetical protein [Arthrospira platensis SPKY1]